MPFVVNNKIPDPFLDDSDAYMKALLNGVNGRLNEIFNYFIELGLNDEDDDMDNFYKQTIKNHRPGLNKRDLAIVFTTVDVYHKLLTEKTKQTS